MGRLAACLIVACGFFAETGACEEPIPLRNDERLIPGRQTQLQVRIHPSTGKHISQAQLETAVRNAMATWNAKLGARLRLVETPPSTEIPRGDLVISVSASDNATYFPPGSNDLAMTGTQVYKLNNRAVSQIIFNDTDSLAKSGGFSTAGALDGSYDLELTTLHELGHALGLAHINPPAPAPIGADLMPPLMAPKLVDNQLLAAHARKTIAQLRCLDPRDEQALQRALDRRERSRLNGNFIIRGKVTAADPGSSVPVGHTLTVSGLNLDDTTGEFVMTYRGERTHAPVSASLLITDTTPLEFKRTLGRTRGLLVTRDNQDQYQAKIVVVPTAYKVTVEGPLEKVP